jgi:hypothetical protein
VRQHGAVEIVGEHTHRVLAYVDALNRHGVRPHPYWVNAFATEPDRLYREEGGLAAVGHQWQFLDVFAPRQVPEETFCDYLGRVGWINGMNDDEIELSSMGRALLNALNSPAIEDTSADVFEIVLNPDNPFAYAQALGGLSSVKNALLVEPYFRLEQLMDVAAFDNITRVLLGSNLKAREYEVLATGLASLPVGRALEIRKAKDLHDRYLIPAEEGKVIMLGASLGGIGKRVSTMTTLGEVASRALRDAHEAIWRAAEMVEPKKPVRAEVTPPEAAADLPTQPVAKESTSRKRAAKKATAKKSSRPPE